MYGELVPMGGGDTIPLLKSKLLVGRRESCDIVLRFPNVSAHHCQLEVEGGYWYVKDLNSRNGVKVNDIRVTEKLLEPGDTFAIAKHKFEIQYSPTDLGAVGPPPNEGAAQQIFGKSLLERAGLERGEEKQASPAVRPRDVKSRYDILNNESGQIKNPNKPV
jgi:predicted component of type VI protein secretion system